MTVGELEFSLSELSLPEDCPISGKTLAEIDPRRQAGATVLAIEKTDGGLHYSPGPKSRIEGGDKLVLLGTEEQHKAFRKMAGCTTKRKG